MYEEFFGFSRRPFSLTPDPEFLYWTDQHRNAFDLVCMSLLRRAPIAVITGEIGAGKTTLLQALLHEISQDFEVGLLSNVVGDSGDLLRWILTSFGHDGAPTSRAEALREVETLLARKWKEGRRSVLIIDEAQNVSDHGIETLRLLTNMDVGKCAPLSLIVAGQPELRERLAGPAFSAFRQRLGASFHLGPMTVEETVGYVRNRIAVAGGAPDVIDGGAIEAVYRRAKGVPRLTNLLCDLCFVAAFGEDRRHVDADLAESAIAESLAVGGLGGLPAEADAAEQRAEVTVRQATASGSPRTPLVAPASTDAETGTGNSDRRRAAAPPFLRLVTTEPGHPPGVEEEPPLRLISPVEAAPAGSAAGLETDAAPAILELRTPAAPAARSRQAVWRIMGSAAGLAVAASVAGAALIMSATETDGVESRSMPAAATQHLRAAASVGEVEPAGTVAEPDGIAKAQLAPAPDPDRAELLFERALEEAGSDPAAAAIDYSRAAAHGHGRAAYYLAQMYETGDGVIFAPDTAWNWYAAAADDVPAAAVRLSEIAALATAGHGVAEPMFSAAAEGVIELVWQGRGSFVVELARRPEAEETVVHATALTAARLDMPEDFAWWRVRAVGSEPSDWARIDRGAAY